MVPNYMGLQSMHYLTFQHEMTHYKHINLEMNAQTLGNNEILLCVHPGLKIHYFTVLHEAIH